MKYFRSLLVLSVLVLLISAVGCGKDREPEIKDGAAAGLAHMERAILYLERGDLDKAMDDLLVAIELMPDSTAPLLAVAGIYEATGEFQRAVESYRAALALNPNIAPAHFQIGLISKRARRNYDTALPRFLKAVELDSTEVEYAYQLADTYHDLERFPEAKKYFEMAVSLDPDHAYAHYGLGEILESHLELLDEGFSEYERAISIFPRDADLRFLVGQAYAGHGRKREAKRHLEEFLRLAPESPKAGTVEELVRHIDRSEG